MNAKMHGAMNIIYHFTLHYQLQRAPHHTVPNLFLFPRIQSHVENGVLNLLLYLLLYTSTVKFNNMLTLIQMCAAIAETVLNSSVYFSV